MATRMSLRKGTVSYEFWVGQQLRSMRDVPIAFDVETERLTDERHIPRLALAVASDGQTHVVIHPDDLADFLDVHRDAHFVGHHVQFDFWVIDQHLQRRGASSAKRILWDACDQGRLVDTMILDMLIQLATGEYRKTGASGRGSGEQKIYPGSLQDVLADYTTLRIAKDDPYRVRFGELIGLDHQQLQDVEPGFLEYATADAIATHRLYPALVHEAYQLMWDYGFRGRAEQFDIRPNAIDQFGYLSEIVQVKASIVLAKMYRRGVHIDLERVHALTTQSRAELDAVVESLTRNYRDVLTFNRDGSLQRTPKSQTPSLGTRKLEGMLTRVATEIQAAGHEIVVPKSQGKQGGISRSVKAWAPYRALHPFLSLWAEMKRLEKRLGFLNSLNAPVLHCQYTLMTRTGRTACAAPRNKEIPGINLQQMPNDEEFRAVFVPPDPHSQLFIADYSAIELRTLAAVCCAKFGRSKLGEVLTSDTDPHAFTAAAIQGLTLDEFLALAQTDSKRMKTARQAAKAINFGVPGGLGAKTLQAYAESNYGVSLTLDEAQAFRQKLITEVYPELNDRDGYLADSGMKSLAHNLCISEAQAWEMFDRTGARNPLAARGVANVIRGTSTASPTYQDRVWGGLFRLIKTVRNADPELVELIARKEGSRSLYDRLYFASAATLTGRIRAGVGFTDSKNTPFQSLAADGAKLALWKLLYKGFDIYGFVHDEILVSIPAATAESDALRIEETMIKSMEQVLGGIPAACKSTVSDYWSKPD